MRKRKTLVADSTINRMEKEIILIKKCYMKNEEH